MSSSCGAVYAEVPAGGESALEAAIKQVRAQGGYGSPLGVMCFDPAVHKFAVVDRWGKQDNMPAWAAAIDMGKATELAALSRLIGRVVAFYLVDEGSEMAVYGAWESGTLVRELQWTDYRWAKVEGVPQPWEDEQFSDKALRGALELGDPGEGEIIRAAFAAKRFIVDAAWPRPEGLCVNMRTVFPAPTFGFQPWTRRSEWPGRGRAS